MDASPPPALRLDGVETSVQRRGLASSLGWAALALLVGPLGVAVGSVTRMAQAPLHLLQTSLLAAPAVALLALVFRFLRVPRYGSISVAGDHLRVERPTRTLAVPLDDLAAGSQNPKTGLVTFRRQSGDLLLVRVPTADDGRRLLEATRMDASRRTLRMKLGSSFFTDILTLLLAPFVFGPMTAGAGRLSVTLTMALTVGLLLVLRRLIGPAEVIVGADGVIVRQGFAAGFIPFGRVARVEIDPARRRLVVFRLTDGSAVEARARWMSDDDREALAARISDARQAWAAGEAGERALARVERRGRSAVAWREAMREVAAADGYREPGVTREALVEVVESPAAPVERRMGAALALSGTDDDDLRRRVRVAAGACADERVRVALTLAADGSLDDDAMEEALAGEAEGGALVRVRRGAG
jgi:hypothetical protein